MNAQHKPGDLVWALTEVLEIPTYQQRPLMVQAKILAIKNYVGEEICWELYSHGETYTAKDSLCFNTKEELITYLTNEECQKD